MITMENHIGKITISNRYLTDLIMNTVSGCVGVADMDNISVLNDICSFLGKHCDTGSGVSIRAKNNRLFIDIHVSVTFGTNIAVVVSSLKHKVKYAVEEATGADVACINVFVDNIRE